MSADELPFWQTARLENTVYGDGFSTRRLANSFTSLNDGFFIACPAEDEKNQPNQSGV